ncbi:MAG: hypothetical protein V7606_187 [Burkholderiales bacterium]
MKTRTTGTTSNPDPSRGPSLYSPEMQGKDPLEGLSILSALDGAPSRPRFGGMRLVALITVVLLLPVTYLVATSSALRQSIPMLALASAKPGKAAEPVAPPGPPPEAAIAAPVIAEQTNVATITAELPAITPAFQEAVAEIKREEAPPQIQKTVITARELEPANTPGPAAPGVPAVTTEGVPSSVAGATSADAKKTQRKGTKDTPPTAISRAKRAETKHAAVSQPPAPANLSRDGDKNDKDVDLIAALLTHLSRPGAQNKDAISRPSGTSSSTAGHASFAGKNDKRTPSRDIVEPKGGESKASLISRCRSLGFLEGELCRIRICSGSWGTDAACSTGTAARVD